MRYLLVLLILLFFLFLLVIYLFRRDNHHGEFACDLFGLQYLSLGLFHNAGVHWEELEHKRKVQFSESAASSEQLTCKVKCQK